MFLLNKMRAKKANEEQYWHKYFEDKYLPSLQFRRALKNAAEHGAIVIIDGVSYQWSGKAWIERK